MRRRRVWVGVTLLLLMAVTLFVWKPVRPAVALGTWKQAGAAGARLDRFAVGVAVPAGGVQAAPRFLHPLLERSWALEKWWVDNHRDMVRAPEGRKYVMVRASVLIPGDGQPTNGVLGCRADVGGRYISPDGYGWTTMRGQPVGLECDILVEQSLPVDAVEIKVGNQWFRFPVE